MTENPYAPPKARIEEVPAQSARASKPFWVRFYLSPFGRTGRLFYWLFGFLPLALIGLGTGFFLSRVPDGTRYVLAVVLLLLWPQAVVIARRLHDLNRPGWFVVLFWTIPYALNDTHFPSGLGTAASFFCAVVLGAVPGTDGPNKYGDDPRRKSASG